MLRTSELEFDLPERLIATAPAPQRDLARLLVVSRSDPSRLEHRLVRDLPGLLRAGDTMVFNTTAVLPARFVGRNLETDGAVQGLYLRDGPGPDEWIVLLRARRHRVGARLELRRPGAEGSATIELLGRAGGDERAWVVRVVSGRSGALERVGLPPLPPYILGARRRAEGSAEHESDAERYQTIYAREPGSVAAPTAGLHFTPALLDRLQDAGVAREEVTLHVGRGTFAPVEAEVLEQHPMHEEWCSAGAGVLERLAACRARGGRVIPVGTTSCRTIEGLAGLDRPALSMLTRLLITPGYGWRVTDGLLTNFHLPRSTLLAMVAALLPEGAQRLLAIYRVAIAQEYRFYSFGDAMLVLP